MSVVEPNAIESAAIVLEALKRFAQDCREADHSFCTLPGACERTLAGEIDRADFDARARRYDLASLTFPPTSEPPSHTWSTAALFRVVVKTLFDEPAWSLFAHQRTVWLTSALARLGERGIPADAVVRTYFGPRIRRQIIFEVVGAHRAIARGKVRLLQIPRALRDWLELVPHRETSDELLYDCLTGSLSTQIESWIQHGALVHLIAWRRNAEMIQVAPEDRVVDGGFDATRWLVDRFTRTRLDDWHRASLDWELAYLSEPLATARTVGVSANVISERPVSESMVVRAISRRTREPAFNDEVFGGMTHVEIMENVIALVLRDERSAALELIGKAVEVAPGDLEFEQTLAFLQIPDHCSESEKRLLALRSRRGVRQGLVAASVAICAIRQGRATDAVAVLTELKASADTGRYWLWSPATLLDEEPVLSEASSLADWSAAVLTVIHR
ncbi:hypothetical protein MHPYR_470019 [uncultured Mycobacterium sp.]|uniref:Uncharacterized protein n=1 Tax=uncultured Mycobacterium sp. TaxID=171292 RepID=A0A1Y5PG35_9MYCO|nr:hypothetical protein MHPYR_470019 [uncultured Mycobacterium sp.]